ncbi:MAG: Trm112 family protein [Myxococcota bacterium]
MSTPPLDPELRALLVCPLTRCELVDVPRGLYSPQADLVFPVEEGVPMMVQECALAPTEEDKALAAAR